MITILDYQRHQSCNICTDHDHDVRLFIAIQQLNTELYNSSKFVTRYNHIYPLITLVPTLV